MRINDRELQVRLLISLRFIMKGKWILKISLPHYSCASHLSDKGMIIWDEEMLKGLWLTRWHIKDLKSRILTQIFGDDCGDRYLWKYLYTSQVENELNGPIKTLTFWMSTVK